MAGDEIGDIFEGAKTFDFALQLTPQRRIQAIGVVLDAERLAAAAELVEHRDQLFRRIAAGLVGPDADIVDDRRMPRLAQIRRARCGSGFGPSCAR